MIKITNYLLTLLTIVLLSSCASSSKIIYLKDATLLNQQEIEVKYDLHIKKDDMLSIIVNCKEPELAAPFNMQLTPQAFTGSNQVSAGYGSGTPQGFLVDSNGEIDYPVFGNLKVEGMSRIQIAEMISEKLVSEGYIQNPVVNVKILNFKVSVLGEVTRPGALKIDSERITLFEALSQAGDLTVYGRRHNVKVIREENGNRNVTEIDLGDPNLLASPFYYLQQNDLVYVEPNRAKASQASYSSFWGTIISVLSLATTIGLYFAK